jgi:hypothetical protein
MRKYDRNVVVSMMSRLVPDNVIAEQKALAEAQFGGRPLTNLEAFSLEHANDVEDEGAADRRGEAAGSSSVVAVAPADVQYTVQSGVCTWYSKTGYINMMKEHARHKAHATQLELAALADVIQANIQVVHPSNHSLDALYEPTSWTGIGEPDTVRIMYQHGRDATGAQTANGHYVREMPNGAIIDVVGDGSCAFRAVATYTKPKLVRAARTNGLPQRAVWKDLDENEANRLRVKACEHLVDSARLFDSIADTGSRSSRCD